MTPGHGRWDDRRVLLLLWAGFVLVRFAVARTHAIVGIDEALYFSYGDSWLRTGTYSGIQWPVTYPLLISALSRLAGARAAVDLVYVLCGSLTIVPLFFAVRRLRGPAAARWTCALVTVLPAASAVSAKSGTHSLYLPLLALGAWLHVRALESGRAAHLLALGAVTGLAYVTRTDGLVYVAIVTGSFALAPRAASMPARARSVALVALGAAPLLLGNVLHVRSYTGRWQFSSSIGQIVQKPFYLKEVGDPELKRMNAELGAGQVAERPGATYFARKIAYNVRLLLRVLGDMHGLTIPGIALAGLGAVRLLRGGGRTAHVVLTWASPPLAFLALNVEPRYFSPTSLFLTVLSGEGLAGVVEALRDAGRARWIAPVAAGVLASLLAMTAMTALALRSIEETASPAKAAAARELAGDRLPETFIFNPQVRFLVDGARGATKSAPMTRERDAAWFVFDPTDEDRDETERLRAAGSLVEVARHPSGLILYGRAP